MTLKRVVILIPRFIKDEWKIIIDVNLLLDHALYQLKPFKKDISKSLMCLACQPRR